MAKAKDTDKVIGLLRWDRGHCYGFISRREANAMHARGEVEWAENPRIPAVLFPRPGDPFRGDSAKSSHKLSQRYVDAKFSGRDQLVIDIVEGLARGMIK